MKANRLLFFSVGCLLALSLQSCLEDSCERKVTYTNLVPVYKSLAEIHAGQVVNEAPRALKSPGKIYFYDHYIFINESREGIHVIDNENPAAPVNIAFLAIPGNEDVAIKDGVLLANSYTDLLALDISNLNDVKLVGRTEDVFQPLWVDIENQRVMVYYKEEEVTETMDCETYSSLVTFGQKRFSCASCGFAGWEGDLFSSQLNDSSAENNASGSGGGSGIAGSMARFSIVNDYLYVVDEYDLRVFDLHEPTAVSLANTVNIGWGIETIFPYEDKLFIGSNSGMFIFDNSNPTAPTLLSTFAHARACDPVFVYGNFAYVTLRDGTTCEGFENQLDLVDVTNLTNPVLLKSFPMDNPHGLSIKGADLLLCEGTHGFKSFDNSDPLSVGNKLLDHIEDVDAYDVIALPGNNDVALVIGKGGFYQYDFSNPNELKLISKIVVE